MNRVHLLSTVVSLDNSGPSLSDYWNIASTIQCYYASKLYYSYAHETYVNCENTPVLYSPPRIPVDFSGLLWIPVDQSLSVQWIPSQSTGFPLSPLDSLLVQWIPSQSNG